MLLRAVLLISAVLLVYRSLLWSLDSPVLRKSLRRVRPGFAMKIAILAVLALGIRFVRIYGDGFFTPTSLLGGAYFLLAGTVIVLFCSFVAQDIREIFWNATRRLWRPTTPQKFKPAARKRRCASIVDRSCHAETNCSATPQPCGARELRNPWRPAELPRKRQHR